MYIFPITYIGSDRFPESVLYPVSRVSVFSFLEFLGKTFDSGRGRYWRQNLEKFKELDLDRRIWCY